MSPTRRRSPAKKPLPHRSKNASGDRLQKVLAAAGVASRRECEQLILAGRVEVDRETVTVLGTRVDPQQQDIRVDGMPLTKPRHVYYVLNKPSGVVSTNRDPEGRPRVIDMVPGEQRLFAIGRLDRSSEGMIIVTNDGELANQLTHPRYGITKTYRAKVIGSPTTETLQQLRKGVHLAEGVARVASLKVRGRHAKGVELEIVLTEGRNREIRRILAQVGHKVQQLRRIAVGPIRLGQLKPGEYRLLSPDEIRLLRRLVEKPSGAERGKDPTRKSASTRSKAAHASQAGARAGKTPGKGRPTAKGKPADRQRGESSSQRATKAKRSGEVGAKKTGAAKTQKAKTQTRSKAARTGTVLDYDSTNVELPKGEQSKGTRGKRRTTERTPGKSAKRTPGKSTKRTPGKSTKKAPRKTTKKAHGKSTKRTPGKTTKKAHGKTAKKRSSGKRKNR